ncbi:MAG: hypothetical protein ACYCZ2_12375 [Lutibacter sp.]
MLRASKKETILWHKANPIWVVCSQFVDGINKLPASSYDPTPHKQSCCKASSDQLNMNEIINTDPERGGLMETLIIVPVLENIEPINPFRLSSKLRDFELKCSISSAPILWEQNITSGSLPPGSSLLKIATKGGQSLSIETDKSSFIIHLNPDKEMAAISATIQAESWEDALALFNSLVNPYLSLLSWKYNVPLTISNISGMDVDYKIQTIKFIQPIIQKTVDLEIGKTDYFDDRLASLYSFNREMLNSPNGAYRLLCIHKSLTIILKIKEELQNRVRKKSLDFKIFKSMTEVKVDDSDYNKKVWPDVIGWNINRLIQDKIRPLRNQIAHEFIESQYANLDKGTFREQVRDYADALLPLMRLQFEKIVDYHSAYLPNEKL